MLSGRLGLERVRIPYNARHGLVWLDRGKLVVRRQANAVFANEDLIPSMIERIKQMLVPP